MLFCYMLQGCRTHTAQQFLCLFVGKIGCRGVKERSFRPIVAHKIAAATTLLQRKAEILPRYFVAAVDGSGGVCTALPQQFLAVTVESRKKVGPARARRQSDLNNALTGAENNVPRP